MTQRNRKTLIANFADGRMPTQEEFGDLIDSVINIVDDGFEKTPTDGVKIAQLNNSDKLISFFDKIPVKEPLWSIAFSMPSQGGDAGSNQNLNFFYGSNHATGLTLARAEVSDTGEETPNDATIRVGINNNNPEHAVDVEGTVASNGRLGRESGGEKLEVLADGEWHSIITGLDGCQAFEIMAGLGKPGSGRYALMHAHALSTFNSKNGNITYHQAYHSSKCDQIELRWFGSAHKYALQMRTRCSYLKNTAKKDEKKEEIYIRYYVTQLWFDPFMDGSAKGQPKIKREPKAEIKPDAADLPEINVKPKRGKVSLWGKILNLLNSIGR